MTQNFVCQAQPVTKTPPLKFPEVRQYSSEARRGKKRGMAKPGHGKNPRLQRKPEDGGSTHPNTQRQAAQCRG